jgi:hypothetical protein
VCVGVGDDAGGETNELEPSHAMAIFRLKKRRDGSKHYSVVGRLLSLISVHSTESMYLILFARTATTCTVSIVYTLP